MKNIESSSIVVQWDVVDDSLPTVYVVTWGDGFGQLVTVEEQTSYTITGLTLDTVYTITVSAANRCGTGPEVRTSVSLSTDTTSTTNISPTVTASTNPMTIISTVNPSSTTTTTVLSTTTANSMTTMYTVSRATGNTTKITSSLTAITTTSSLGATIADTTTTTTSVTITIVTTTTVITNACLNIGMYFQNTYVTIELFCKVCSYLLLN